MQIRGICENKWRMALTCVINQLNFCLTYRHDLQYSIKSMKTIFPSSQLVCPHMRCASFSKVCGALIGLFQAGGGWVNQHYMPVYSPHSCGFLIFTWAHGQPEQHHLHFNSERRTGVMLAENTDKKIIYSSVRITKIPVIKYENCLTVMHIKVWTL